MKQDIFVHKTFNKRGIFIKQASIIILLGLFCSACGITRKTGDFNSAIKTGSATENTFSTKPLETGVASWYGPKFNGRLTANGETYDMDKVTAAHRTLPFGTILLVENLDNGKTVEVRINDRGPYAKNRIIDLSKGAAEKVGMIEPGTANVRLYLLKGDVEGITNLKIPHYTVQLGSFTEITDAQKLADKISDSYIKAVQIGTKQYYRVYFGNYQNTSKAKKELQRLQRKGFTGFVKQIENN